MAGSSRRRRAEISVDQLIQNLRSRRYATMTELRQVERIAASASEDDQARFQEPMTSAWKHYVTSNNMLNELRGLTRDFPFSSECLDEAHLLVLHDPASNRSWNVAWLILQKIQERNLVEEYSMELARRRSMWGGRRPTDDEVRQLTDCFAYAWDGAMDQMLRHWPTPPTTTGY